MDIIRISENLPKMLFLAIFGLKVLLWKTSPVKFTVAGRWGSGTPPVKFRTVNWGSKLPKSTAWSPRQALHGPIFGHFLKKQNMEKIIFWRISGQDGDFWRKKNIGKNQWNCFRVILGEGSTFFLWQRGGPRRRWPMGAPWRNGKEGGRAFGERHA